MVDGNWLHKFPWNVSSYLTAGSPSVGQAELFWSLGNWILFRFVFFVLDLASIERGKEGVGA